MSSTAGIFGIYKIVSTLTELSKTNKQLKTNRKIQIIHGIVLALLPIAVL